MDAISAREKVTAIVPRKDRTLLEIHQPLDMQSGRETVKPD
jgi:hypothetical protein